MSIKTEREKIESMSVSHHEVLMDMLRNEPEYRRAMLNEIGRCILTGDVDVGKSLLTDVIESNLGFSKVEKSLRMPAGSVSRMLEPGEPALATELSSVLTYVNTAEGNEPEVVRKAA